MKFKDDFSKELIKLKRDIRNKIVYNGLDEKLVSDIKELKIDLLNYVNNKKQKIDSKEDILSQEISNIPESDKEIIQHYTGLDIENFKKTKELNDLVDNQVAFIKKDRNAFPVEGKTSSMSPGIEYEIDMNQFDTFDSQYAKAQDYFNNSLYVFEENGKRYYFKNPGSHNLTQFIKVLCSPEVGDTAKSRKRFEKYRTGNNRNRNVDKQGIAQWTLKKEALDYIKTHFIDLTSIIDNVKEGNFEEAENEIQAKAINSNNLTDLQEKTQALKKNENLAPSVEAYTNLIKIIKNISLGKKIFENNVTYFLVSNDTYEQYENEEVVLRIKQILDLWQIKNEHKWLNTLVRKINKLLAEYKL